MLQEIRKYESSDLQRIRKYVARKSEVSKTESSGFLTILKLATISELLKHLSEPLTCNKSETFQE